MLIGSDRDRNHQSGPRSVFHGMSVRVVSKAEANRRAACQVAESPKGGILNELREPQRHLTSMLRDRFHHVASTVGNFEQTSFPEAFRA